MKSIIFPSDWKIENTLILSFVVLVVSIGTAVTGIDWFGIRAAAGLIFLVFVPGILLLRIFKIHNVSLTEGILYSVGLSIASVIAMGVIINFAAPLFGAHNPLSPYPIVVGMGLLVLVLMAIAYFRDKDFCGAKSISWDGIGRPMLIAFVLISVVIFGAVTHNSVVLFAIPIAISAIIVAFVLWRKPKAYPIILFSVSLCLLFQTTLLSKYLTGSDIIAEHWFHRYTLDTGYWVYSAPAMYASSLSIVMLSPIYSLVLGVSGIWIFKVVFPIIFSLMPIALYLAYGRFLEKRLAFIAAFLSVVIPVFLLEMISVMRQQIAVLFFALVLSVLFSRNLQSGRRILLTIIFSIALAVSYYGLGIMYIFYFSVGCVLLFLISRFGRKMRSRFSHNGWTVKRLGVVLSVFLLFCIGYYTVTAGGSIPLAIATIVDMQKVQITENPASQYVYHKDFVPPSDAPYHVPNPVSEKELVPVEGGELERPSFLELLFGERYRSPLLRIGLGLDFTSVTIHGRIFRVIQHIIHALIIVGFIGMFFIRRKLKFPLLYVSMVIACAILILAYVFLPVVSSYMGATRFYYISMILFTPLVVFGGAILFRWKRQWFPTVLAVAIVVPYFMFTSGLVFEAFKYNNTDRVDIPYSIAISSHRIDVGGVFNDRDAQGAKFLDEIFTKGDAVFMDFYSTMIVCDVLDLTAEDRLDPICDVRAKVWLFPWDVGMVPDNVYVYLRSWNVEHREITYYTGYGLRRIAGWDEMDFERLLEGRDLLFDNGARVYSPRGSG